MPKYPKKKEGNKSGRDAGEPETKQREQVRAQCLRTRNKTNGSNLRAMQENPKQKDGIKSGHDVGEPEIKGGDRIRK